MMMRVLSALLAFLPLSAASARADWPTLRGSVERTGYVDAEIKPPFRVAWVRHFVAERIGSAVEPVVADGKVFIGTHNGNLYALDAESGKPLWRFQADGPILHSPAVVKHHIIAGTTRGTGYMIEAATGTESGGTGRTQGSLSASPTFGGNTLWWGDRTGGLHTDKIEPSLRVLPPDDRSAIRQTGAFAEGRFFVTGEDLRVRAVDARSRKLLWVSEPLVGQTARDYYPVIANKGGRTVVIVRTNPVIRMSRLIGMDRTLLCANAGLKDTGWKAVAAWCKSKEALGTPELWEKEQQAILEHLDEHKEARTFFVLDAETGKLLPHPPVLWAAGCQGVGTPPVVMPDGRLLVYYRTAYGNWTHGVAPLVGLGFLDLEKNRIEPLTHAHGMRPPWNTFWGTADESQNFLVARNTVLIVHQGTLSGFDLKTKKLFLIAGKRDTWGGFKNLPWARNEWHGPARGGVAIACPEPGRGVGNRIYWQVGSRILCIVSGEKGEPAKDEGIDAKAVKAQHAPPAHRLTLEAHKDYLNTKMHQLVLSSWAPLYVEPGLSGREFHFDDSGELFEALAWAAPHAKGEVKEKLKALLAQQWTAHPPFTRQAWYPLDKGERRELFRVPPDVLRRTGRPAPHHPFGNVHAVWLYAERCGEWDRVTAAWPGIKACFADFAKAGWKLDPEKGDLKANRYLASLLAFARIAGKAGDADAARQATAMADRATEALIAWWKAVAARISPRIFADIREWDAFIHKGNGLFYRVSGHKSKVALFHDLTPEVAAIVKAKAPEAVAKVWTAFETLCPTWHLVGEERQVHFGENFVDPPDFALDAFKALAWLRGAPADELAARADIPFCRADLAHLAKLAIAAEQP